MTEAQIVATLDEAERALDEGRSLGDTEFWAAVRAVKASPELADRFAPRIGDIDQRAFLAWPRIVLSPSMGTTLAVVGTALGLGGVAAAYYLDEPGNVVVFGMGLGALLGATHGLGHLLVGQAMGIRFTHWFMASVTKPQPGVKVDYASYLRTPPRRRAWMHAAGALVTKLVPFALIPAAVAADLPAWAGWALAAFGTVQVVTDAVWSVKASDWKRFRREMRYAR